jgi:hypothetical protein
MGTRPLNSEPGSNKGGAYSSRHIQAVERQRSALDMRRAGATYDQIARALGYASASGARKAIALGLKATLREPAAELRELMLDRLDTGLRAIWPRIITGDDAAIASMIRIEKRRAELLGLDAPKVTEFSGQGGAPLVFAGILVPVPARSDEVGSNGHEPTLVGAN